MPEKHSQPPGKLGWRWKRTVAAVLLLLAGGAIVNVAVAWGCFFLVGFDFHTDSDIRVEPGDWIHTVSPFVESGASVTRQRAFGKQRDMYFSFGSSLEATDVGWVLAERTAIGWPLKAIEAAEVLKPIDGADASHGPDRTPVLQGAITGWVLQGAISVHGRAVPIHARYPAFGINTLFYALLLWLFFIAPFAARRMLRRRRGQCEKCAYPIGVSPVCTECGAAVPRKVEA